MPAAPRFWTERTWKALALAPLAWTYGAVAARRMRNAPRLATGLPVLCVGNLTVGGNGKTPVVIALAQAAKAAGLRPGILSRGHGGRVGSVRMVDPKRDTARDVGDEPLLLCAHAPVAVGADRASGAQLLKQAGCDFLLMDDGFQSGRIAVDLALLVIDRRFGLGNGFCLPAGPLRAPLAAQFDQKPELLAMGEGGAADTVIAQAEARGLAVHAARLVPTNGESVRGQRVLAFAGIGHPEKFFASLKEAGAAVVERRALPDHHPFKAGELRSLEGDAQAHGLALATTAKDKARLGGTAPTAFMKKLLVLEVAARFDQPEASEEWIARTLANFRLRALREMATISTGPRTD